MAKPKLKNPRPSAETVFAAARALLEIAYRMKTEQVEGWKGQEPARILLDRIMEPFKNFDEGCMKSTHEFSDLMSLEKFINIHRQCKELAWSEEKLRKQLFNSINNRGWGNEEFDEARTEHPDFDKNGKVIPDMELPEEWVKLQRNPSKTTPQGVIEDAIYTWSTICGYGRGDTKLKQLRRKGKRGAIKPDLLTESMKWFKNGEQEKFEDAVLMKLFGWNRKTLTDGVVKRCVEEAVEMGLEAKALS